MIRTYLELRPRAGRLADLVAFFTEHQILERSAAVEGCHSVEMTVSDDESMVIVTGVWDDTGVYGRWIDARSGDADGAEALAALIDQPVDGSASASIFTIVRAVTSPGAEQA